MKRFVIVMAAALLWAGARGGELLDLDLCRGSRMPYPAPDSVEAVPDSLTPLMINHVGRHGARYATSADRFLSVEAHLRAHSDSLTPAGRRLLEITSRAIDLSADRWGELDSLGAAEQRGIAARLCLAFPQLVVGREVTAVSSYVGRCVASMDAFTSEVRRMQSGLGSVSTSAGRQYSELLRPFETDTAYVDWAHRKPYGPVLKQFEAAEVDARAIVRRFTAVPYSEAQARELAGAIYYTVSSLAAMGMPEAEADEAMALLGAENYNALWEADNLRQYLSRTQTTVSALPAQIAAPLLLELVRSTDDFIAGRSRAAVELRFGHAETLMPLLSLMRLPRCYYLTHYFDTVAAHWQTWHVVPMAANLQLILLESDTGRLYVRIDLNERPVEFPGGHVYLPWSALRSHLLALIAN